MRLAVGFCSAIVAIGCGSDTRPDENSDTITWYREVEPIVQVHCQGCHAVGGIGPLVFDADTVQELAGHMAVAVKSRQMPPWQPSDLGPALLGDRRITDEQIATIAAWADAGAPLGDPADHQERDPVRSFTLNDPTHSFAMTEAYYPNKSLEDDVRCFVLELPFTTNTWLRALRFNMDQRVMVHHIGAGIASGPEAAKARQLDANDAGPGYACAGGFRVQLSSGLGIGGPGAEGYEYPDGAGAFIPAGSVAILTVHYYTPYAGSAADRSGIDMWVSPTPLRPMGQYSLNGPSELPCPGGISTDPTNRCSRAWALAQPGAFSPVVNEAINNNLLRRCGYTMDMIDDGLSFADSAAAKFLVSRTCLDEVPYSGTLRLVSTHMHTRGNASRIEVERGGSWQVLFDIPQWDWHWEQSYLLAENTTVQSGEKLRVTCTFDNGRQNQPPDLMRGGVPEDVRYVTAAEGRTDEMCGGSLWIERTAGPSTLCAQAKATYDSMCPTLTAVSTSLWGGACDDTAERYAVQLLQTPDSQIPYFWCDVEPTGTTGATCQQTLGCAVQCTSSSCIDACKASASARALHRFNRTMACAATWCTGDTGQLWGACLAVACGAEYTKCLQ